MDDHEMDDEEGPSVDRGTGINACARVTCICKYRQGRNYASSVAHATVFTKSCQYHEISRLMAAQAANFRKLNLLCQRNVGV